jgi:hypothetical protein
MGGGGPLTSRRCRCHPLPTASLLVSAMLSARSFTPLAISEMKTMACLGVGPVGVRIQPMRHKSFDCMEEGGGVGVGTGDVLLVWCRQRSHADVTPPCRRRRHHRALARQPPRVPLPRKPAGVHVR